MQVKVVGRFRALTGEKRFPKERAFNEKEKLLCHCGEKVPSRKNRSSCVNDEADIVELFVK